MNDGCVLATYVIPFSGGDDRVIFINESVVHYIYQLVT
jgi:hypothetical protein